MSNYFVKSFILLLFSSIVYAVLIYPWYVEARAKHDHMQYLKTVISQVHTLNEKRDALQAEFNSIQPNKVSLIRNAVPSHSSENVILFFLSLDAFIAQSGLPVDTPYVIESEVVNPETATVTIPIRFDFEAVDYNLLTQFIGNLQRWERAVRIESVQIWSVSGERNSNTVRASVQIQALFSSQVTSPLS